MSHAVTKIVFSVLLAVRRWRYRDQFPSSLGLQIGDEFAQADFRNPGTYTGNFGTMKVTETPTATPEPGSFALKVAGLLGLLFVKRNLIA